MTDTLTRREFLSAAAAITLLPALPHIGAVRAAEKKKVRTLLWISPDGGESQIDTWDPKPDAPEEIRGELGTIRTAIAGVRIGEVYPRMSKLLDKVTLLRARKTEGELNHLPAMRQMLRRGRSAHLLSDHAKRAGGLPALYAETNGVINGFDYRREAYGVGTLSMEMLWSGKDERYLPPDLGEPDPRLPGKMSLLGKLDRRGTPEADRFAQLQEEAALLIGRIRGSVKLKKCDIEAYGDNQIGIGMLTMRELARQGLAGALAFRAGDWDDHFAIFKNLPPRAAQMDRALSALVTDIKRGRLGDALLVYGSEFGRTPVVNVQAGRDHHAWGTSILCGTGIKEGFVHGETDNRGNGKEGVVTTAQFAETVLEALAAEPDFGKRSELPPVFARGKRAASTPVARLAG